MWARTDRQCTYRKVLLIQTAFLGDVIMATSLLESMHKYVDNVQIDVLVKKGCESVLSHHPFVRKVFIWRKDKQKYRFLFGLSKQIRDEKYDLIVNLQRHFSTACLCVFSRAKRMIGYNTSWLSIFFSNRFRYPKTGMHEIEKNFQLVKALFPQDAIPLLPKVYPSSEDEKTARELSKQYETFITVSVGSAWYTKCLPEDKWIDFLAKTPPNTGIFFLGGKNEYEKSAYIIEKIRQTRPFLFMTNLCGYLSFLPSAALMRLANMNYALDSAPTHIASAVNAPITTIYCSTSPIFGFTPLSEQSRILLSKEKLSCHPCTNHGRKKCPRKHFLCAKTVMFSSA